jgi:hypothetical protein
MAPPSIGSTLASPPHRVDIALNAGRSELIRGADKKISGSADALWIDGCAYHAQHQNFRVERDLGAEHTVCIPTANRLSESGARQFQSAQKSTHGRARTRSRYKLRASGDIGPYEA